ncbi:hypothetical protein [Cecembia calidifontis]|uniref:Outer membrane protein with beta-barrel domain n=1 Tax=Cecembia calidifontis TaxID=1187080 RepID=A0A4Q7PC89_9BACT|nr:hypothetical protein [Cecembia calidifontis]RZS96412.1 hypothetical protein BC751_1983 [Cecembia calidifontis]
MKILKNISSLFILFVISGFSNHVAAQEEAEVFTAKNVVYAELLGNAGLYAVNYGRIFYQKDKLKLMGGLGFSMIPLKGFEPFYPNFWSPVIPVEFSAFWGKSRHHLELGIGSYVFQNRKYWFDPEFPPTYIREIVHWDTSVTMRIGYRYQKPEGGFFFRAGYTPRVDFTSFEFAQETVQFVPFSVGISFGKSF